MSEMREPAPVDRPDQMPSHCPYCESRDIDNGFPQWLASSLEPCDPNNKCELQEWQCLSCGAVFWL